MENWEAAYLAGIIDGEGTITLTRHHSKEHRRPCISISSNDLELLIYIQSIAGGRINSKKNYHPTKHKNSYTLYILKKHEVFSLLKRISPYLKIEKKRKRAQWIVKYYDKVTVRNGKYTKIMLEKKKKFEEEFFLQ
ncbi:hypothetical protein GLV94_02685 [Virgibacillus halodenitrificans]|uniref:LAGLIDADG family homing endonuclease n=1 Tax=Virgibacillus halodenitrificans TaxID=1482 RepID=UPI00045C5D7E|nr:LAGLIDADG family homing endonuclease [Virgibacillus halodenitrificans]MCG1026914.1 LAGLIDADG family homing endonuclease [Virgibacillus halodenitrificans]MYL44540.1 hypothetical protein [Virgibacillus halodenitrificans]WHX26819.1 LAGLIDADG family homing endonuclease [Virgibacillus halodenitrificans]CDQ30764.1 hypothetical protein BN993_00126 [Virgibacillus halodenitrificans]